MPMPRDPAIPPELISLQAAVVGRYSLVRELGRGGMGIVFLARDVALDRPVAIKLLPPEFALAAAHRARFIREARTAARLSHPHIVPIHSVEERGDLVFFVMSYVDGDTLAARVSRDGPLPGRDAMRITREVAWALGHAHANGVVHRDVKPENILLERGTDRALVTDFGIAQAIDAPDTSSRGRVAGTPRYMSPEQASGEPVDGRSDLYSLAGVAFFAVTGRSPYEAPSAAAMLVKQLSAPVPSVLVANPRVPLPLASAIERCLAKDPADRYQSADDLARAIEPVGTGVAAPIAAFLRDMDVAGGEIGSGAAAFLSSSFMVALAAREPAGISFGDAISLTIALVLFMGAAATMGGMVLVRLAHVIGRMSQLLRSGYGHAAVRPAIRAAIADNRDGDEGRMSPAGILVRLAGIAGSIWLTQRGSGWLPLVGAAGAIVIPTIAMRRIWNQRQAWPRMLAGRFGAALFRLARIKAGSLDAKPAAGEPTAAAIGHGARELFDALPHPVRAELPALPAAIERLEVEAIRSRARQGEDAQADFAAAVSALESLRLDLLRLHAGRGSVHDLTGSVEAARRVGEEIDVRLAAAGELDQALRDSAG